MSMQAKKCYLQSFVVDVVKIDYDEPKTFVAAKQMCKGTQFVLTVIDGNFMVILEDTRNKTMVQVVGNVYVVKSAIHEDVVMLVTETEFKKMYNEVRL